MHYHLSIGFAILVAAFFLGGGLLMILIGYAGKGSFTLRTIAAIACWLGFMGFAGFVATLLSSAGAMDLLPSSVEWPAGFVDGIITLKDGSRIVPLRPPNRIQVYTRDWKFVRGWRVKAGMGHFELVRLENSFQVITARNDMVLEYNARGELLSKRKYETGEYEPLTRNAGTLSAWIDTPLYMLPLCHPILSVFCIMVGMGLYTLVKKLGYESVQAVDEKKQPQDPPPPSPEPVAEICDNDKD